MSIVELLAAVRALRSALEHPVPYPGRPRKTTIELSDDRAERIRVAFHWAVNEVADGLPLGVEMKLRELLGDLTNLQVREREDPNQLHRRALNQLHEIEAALAALPSAPNSTPDRILSDNLGDPSILNDPVACRQYLDHSDRQALEHTRTLLATLPGEVNAIAQRQAWVNESNISENPHVNGVLNFWREVQAAQRKLSNIDTELRRSCVFSSPEGTHWRNVAWLLDESVMSAWLVIQQAQELEREIRAFATAAARQRGIIAAGAELSDDAIRELSATVRPAAMEESDSLAEAPTPEPSSVSVAPADPQQGERETLNNRAKGASLEEANIRVRDWLKQHAKDDPTGITRDRIVSETGVSAGQVSKTAAWKAFRDHRAAEVKPGSREMPLSDQMKAIIPIGTLGKAESEQRDALLNELIREQDDDEAEQVDRHKRRHGPS